MPQQRLVSEVEAKAPTEQPHETSGGDFEDEYTPTFDSVSKASFSHDEELPSRQQQQQHQKSLVSAALKQAAHTIANQVGAHNIKKLASRDIEEEISEESIDIEGDER